MTDGNQNVTSRSPTTTTTATATFSRQSHTSLSFPPMVAGTSAPSFGVPVPTLPHQEHLPIQYSTPHSYLWQGPLPQAGYLHAPSTTYPPPPSSESSYASASSSGPGGLGLPSRFPSMPGSSYMPAVEPLLMQPPGFVHDSHQPLMFPQDAPQQQSVSSFPADTQYPPSAPDPHILPTGRGPMYQTHPAEHFQRIGYPRFQSQIPEPHSQQSPPFQYLLPSHIQEKPFYTEELAASQYAGHQQRWAKDISHIDEELAVLSQKQQQIQSRMQLLQLEKSQLAYEQRLEQERLHQMQECLTQESLMLQRMRFCSISYAPYASEYGAPYPTVQVSQQNVFFPSPSQQAGLSPPLHQPMASQYAGPGHLSQVTESEEFLKVEPQSTAAMEPSPADATGSIAATVTTAASVFQLRPEVAAFKPSEVPRTVHVRPPHRREHPSKYLFQHHSSGAGQSQRSQAVDPLLHQDMLKRLRSYALDSMVPSSDVDEQAKLEVVKRTVTRVPAVCFNEQKFLDREDYQILLQPQSPAVRGQEALARVCFVLEQAMRLKGIGATIISDYKFKENYLKRAPQEVLSVLNRPEDEGSHNVLMMGPQIGIVCIQVTCVEESTNNSTVKKQVRDTLRQLKKDEKVIRHVMDDLGLAYDCVRLVMALPNVTTDQLMRKLETKYIKILSSALNTTDDLEDLLTLDHLPGVGHRHWLSTESRDQLWGWLDRLVRESIELSVENYLQIFARYTCGWSVPEVWSISKPRVLIRSWAHAVAETYRRYHHPALTPQQESLLHMKHSHLLITASAGSGHTCLLKAKAITELRLGHAVLVCVPPKFTTLRKDYEQLAVSNEQYQESMYFWSYETVDAEGSRCSFKTVDGTCKTLDDLTERHQEIVALFEHTNHDQELLRLCAKVMDNVGSVWVMFDAAARQISESLPKKDIIFFPVQLLTVTRLPSIIQILVNHPCLEGASAKSAMSTTSAQDPQSESFSTLRGPEVSSYQGLPTDGPFPLFIWHPVTASRHTQHTILKCQLCMNQLRSAVQSLVSETTSRTDTDTAEDGTRRQKQESDSSATEHSDSRDTTPRDTTAADGDRDAKSGEANIHINSGNVPQPLTTDDVVLFVDSREHVNILKDNLNLVNAENIIYPLEDLPSLVGSEKAVVGIVGRVDVQATDTVLQALVSKFRDVMTLCQGQLIVAVELKYNGPEADSTEHQQHRQPFQLHIEDMMRKSWREHNL